MAASGFAEVFPYVHAAPQDCEASPLQETRADPVDRSLREEPCISTVIGSGIEPRRGFAVLKGV